MAKSDTTSKPGSSGWHLALARASDPPVGGGYLGDIKVVDALIREFVVGICERFAAVAGGTQTLAQVRQADQQAAYKLACIMRGIDMRYRTVGAWNRDGGGLAKALRWEFDIRLGAQAQHSDADAVFQALGLLVFDTYTELAKAAQAGDDPQAEARAQAAIAASIDRYAKLFTGVPTP